MEFEEKLSRAEDKLLDSPRNFLIFCFAIIFIVLFQYSFTHNALIPVFLLGALWILFWSRSTDIGKAFLLIATVLGYAHEILGVHMGWFSYATGDFGVGVPLWVAIGYGCIFWSVANFWSHAEARHMFPQRYFRFIWPGCLAAFFVLDFFVFQMTDLLFLNLAFVVLMYFLFSRPKDQHFALTIALFCGLEEVVGALLGAWHHPVLSLVKVIPPYMFFGWMILFVVFSLMRGRIAKIKELLIAGAMLLFWILRSFIFETTKVA